MARAAVSLDAANETVTLTPCDIGGGAGGFHITGTWTGTITFEAKAPEATAWVSILATNVTTEASATTTTANGIFRVVADGLHVRARFSTATSGTVVVYPYEVGL